MNFKTHWGLVGILLLVLALLVAGCGGQNDGAQSSDAGTKDKILIRLAHGAAPNHPWNLAAEKFAETVSEETDGRVEFQIFTAGQMGSDREMTEALQNGTLQMAIVSTMAMSAFEPAVQVYDLPYLFPSYEKAYEVLDGPIGEEVAAKLIPKGIRVLAYWENDFRHFSNSKRPIETVEDLQGIKMRVPETPILIAWLESIGAAPTPVPYNELYSSLQTKMVDGQDNGVFLTHSAKYYEVQEYYSLTGHIYSPAPLMINETFYQSLPDDIKQVIDKAAIEMRDYQRQLDREQLDSRLEEMKAAGLKVNEISPENLQGFIDSTEAVYDKFKNQIDQNILRQILEVTR